MPKEAHKVVVIGHRNPDTDSICSAIAYAELKNKTSDLICEPRRAGKMNQETEFVLKKFGVEPPRMCTDVNPKIRDVDYREMEGVDGSISLRRAWEIMRDRDVDTLPVVSPENDLLGVITVKDVATANMDVFDTAVLAKTHTTYKNILETLGGEMVVGSADGVCTAGNVHIGTATPEMLESAVEKGDIVILTNRYESQLCAIEREASLIIVCNDSKVGKTISRIAAETGVDIMTVPFDTYAAGKLISQCAPISYYMTTQNILKFTRVTPVADVTRVMAKTRHRYFPILDEEGKYCGMVSRRNIINLRKRRIILVDHNEATQAVEGFDQAEILEIIDHHRIGSLETAGPVYFRNQPVGCTATIVTQMYDEQGVEIRPQIAGLMLAAIGRKDRPPAGHHRRGGCGGICRRDVRGRRKAGRQDPRGGLFAGLQGVHVRRPALWRGAGQLHDPQEPAGRPNAADALPRRGAPEAERRGPVYAPDRGAPQGERGHLHRAARARDAARRL